MDKQPNTDIENLREILLKTLDLKEVYIVPDANIKLQYPCIVLTLNDMRPWKANNGNYMKGKSYNILLMEVDFEEESIPKLLELDYCSLDTPQYVSDGIYHSKLTIYY